MVLAAAAVLLAAGLVLRWRRASPLWWFVTAAVLLLMFLGFWASAIVVVIGLGKLIVMTVGRGQSLECSRIRAGRAAAPPKGLVESVGHEDWA